MAEQESVPLYELEVGEHFLSEGHKWVLISKEPYGNIKNSYRIKTVPDDGRTWWLNKTHRVVPLRHKPAVSPELIRLLEEWDDA